MSIKISPGSPILTVVGLRKIHKKAENTFSYSQINAFPDLNWPTFKQMYITVNLFQADQFQSTNLMQIWNLMIPSKSQSTLILVDVLFSIPNISFRT